MAGAVKTRSAGKKWKHFLTLKIDELARKVHDQGMFSKKPPAPRKSLRERVAERQSGQEQQRDPLFKNISAKKNIGHIILGANILQGVGIILLLFAMGGVVRSEYAVDNWTPIIIYSSMFIFGRAIVTLAGMMKKSRH